MRSSTYRPANNRRGHVGSRTGVSVFDPEAKRYRLATDRKPWDAKGRRGGPVAGPSQDLESAPTNT